MAVYSRQFFPIAGVIIFALGAILIILEPDFIRTIVVIGAYLGSIILAGLGISAQRKYRSIRAEVATLRGDMNQLLQIESRRFMVELKSGGKTAPSEANARPPSASAAASD
jgi:hypothetical protein